MQLLKNVRVGVSHHPLLFIFGVYNVTVGLKDIMVSQSAAAPTVPWSTPFTGIPFWGIFGFVLGVVLIFDVVRDGGRMLRTAREFQSVLDGAKPREKTRLLVGLRAYSRAHGLRDRSVAFVAGMTAKRLDEWTIGAKAVLSNAEWEDIRNDLAKMAELDTAWAMVNKGKTLRRRVACVVVPVLGASLAYVFGVSPLLGGGVPLLAIAILWLMSYVPDNTTWRTVYSIQSVVFGRDVPEEVQIAASSLGA
jgi:hypothetical protein